jgi:hypothetical protein
MANSKDHNNVARDINTRLTNSPVAEDEKLEDHMKKVGRGIPTTTGSDKQCDGKVVPLALQGRSPPEGRQGEGSKVRFSVSHAAQLPL